MLPTLRQLEYVVAVADSGQFVAAAAACGVSQPALSKQIREVEDMLGVALFERVRPRVLTTLAGEEIVRRARLLLADARDLVAVGRAAGTGRRGTLRLGVIPTIAPYGLPGLIASLRGRYPGVSFAIEELQTEVLLERLRAGRIDLGLLARSFDDSSLAGCDLVVEPFVLVAPADHRLGQSAPLSARDIAGESLILMQDGHCLRDQAIDVCAVAGTPPPTSVAAASISTLTRMVESGLGPTLLPASALSVELRPEHGVVARAFSGSPPSRVITLQWRATSPSASWFEELGERLREHYLSLNATMPDVCGPVPMLRAVEDE